MTLFNRLTIGLVSLLLAPAVLAVTIDFRNAGGNGGSVFLVADKSMTTLADFRVARKYRAETGQGGAGRNMTGRSGANLDVKVPPLQTTSE